MNKPSDSPHQRFPLAAPPYDLKVAEAMAKVDMGDLSPQNFLRVLAHHPRIMSGVVSLGGTLMYRTALPERLREIAILRVAARTKSKYEWAMHRALFETRCELTAQQMQSLQVGSEAEECWSDQEQLVIRAVDELHETSTVSPATWDAIRAQWQPPIVMELLVVIGFYHMLAFFLNATGVAPEDGARHLVDF